MGYERYGSRRDAPGLPEEWKEHLSRATGYVAAIAAGNVSSVVALYAGYVSAGLGVAGSLFALGVLFLNRGPMPGAGYIAWVPVGALVIAVLAGLVGVVAGPLGRRNAMKDEKHRGRRPATIGLALACVGIVLAAVGVPAGLQAIEEAPGAVEREMNDFSNLDQRIAEKEDPEGESEGEPKGEPDDGGDTWQEEFRERAYRECLERHREDPERQEFLCSVHR